jgi:hypothetical protein
MSTHLNPTEQTYETAADTAPIAPTATLASTRSEVWTVDRVRALGVITTLATAASVLGISRSQAYRLAAADAFPAPLIRAGSRIVVPVAGLLRLLLVATDPATASSVRRLDPGREVSVDATTARPADYAYQRWRYQLEHPGDDE